MLRSSFFSIASLFVMTSFSLIAKAQETAPLQSHRPVIAVSPVQLDWQSFKWQTLNYARIPIDGGAALYTLPSQSSEKFRIMFTLANGIFSLNAADRTSLAALSDLFITSGSGSFSYEEIQNFTNQYGISIGTNVNGQGQITLTVEALSEDFSRALSLVQNILLKPKFNSSALTLWQQQSKNYFSSLLDANSLEKQYRFMEYSSNKLIFGSNSYYASIIKRNAPVSINAVTLDSVKKLYTQVLNRNGMNVFLSGAYTTKNVEQLLDIMSSIPRNLPPIVRWLPNRPLVNQKEVKDKKYLTILIRKTDMTQSNIFMRYYFPNQGQLNSIEKFRISLLEDVFSSSGGIVGNDRISKALRADTGISYSPYGRYNADGAYPNTNVGVMNIVFQSSNERLSEAVSLAKKTWDIFINEGISQAELDKARTSSMNRMLATEMTVFDKASEISLQIERGFMPKVDPQEQLLNAMSQETDPIPLNDILKQISNGEAIPVLVIMGNPDKKQLNELIDNDIINSYQETTIDDIVKDNN